MLPIFFPQVSATEDASEVTGRGYVTETVAGNVHPFASLTATE